MRKPRGYQGCTLANSEISISTFDLQSVQSLPSTHTSLIYYKGKLICITCAFTTFALLTDTAISGLNTMAEEAPAKLASVQWKTSNVPSHSVKHVCLFANSCGGQNRTQFTAAAIMLAAQQFDFAALCFLESGHMQMEVDSVHSAIEDAKKRMDLYMFDGFKAKLQMAQKRSQPYSV